MNENILSVFILLFIYSCSPTKETPTKRGAEKQYKAHTVAFYNVENLFSLEDDPNTVFHDRTPRGEMFYNEEVYNLKQNNLAKVISDIGKDFTGTTPTVVGLVEIENYNVINDLVNQAALKDSNYSIIHYDSPDLRGIDVGLICRKREDIPTNSVSHRLDLGEARNTTRRLPRRAQLVGRVRVEKDMVYVIVRHVHAR